ARFLGTAHGSTAMTRSLRLGATAVAAALLAACNPSPQPVERQYGAEPDLPQPQRGLLPNMTISTPVEWGDLQPVAPAGFTVRAIATDLGIPRQTLVLPNGDILVAEGRGGYAKPLKPKDVIAGMIKSRGNTSVPSGNRVTRLRGADGDGTYQPQTVFAEGLDAPYGRALAGDGRVVAHPD